MTLQAQYAAVHHFSDAGLYVTYRSQLNQPVFFNFYFL